MISDIRRKRKSSLENNHLHTTNNHHSISSLTKRFRTTNDTKKLNSNELQNSIEMTITNSERTFSLNYFDESKLTPAMLVEYRHLQQELQCQEAFLVLMQKLKTNQKLISQTNNNNNHHSKQRTSTPITATKLSQQTSDVKMPLTATKQPLNNSIRSNPIKTPHPNQYTVNRSNQHSQPPPPPPPPPPQQQQQSSKNSLALSQATRQSNTNNNHNQNSLPTTATRLSSNVQVASTKTSSTNSTNNTNSSKNTNIAAEQHLLNAKLALRKQLEQTLLQIPTPKPSTCDLTFIPGVNGWSEFLAYLGLEQALHTFTDIVMRRTNDDYSFTLPFICSQCGTDWSVTWHEISTINEKNSDEKILCDRCTKTSQKKLLKQDHSNRLRQAFIKALQQEKELDAKYQQQSTTTTTTTNTNANTSTTIKQSSSSSQQATKHSHQSTKSVSTKPNSNHHHHHHHHHHNNTNNTSNQKKTATTTNNNNTNHHHHHHHRHHSNKTNSSKIHHFNSSTLPNLTAMPAETLASTLAALQTSEQMELFQKHFFSNMLPFAVANQTAAAALAAKTTQQQQQQQQAAALAASFMRQTNPAQYLLDMIPQAAKQQQQQQQHRHSK